VPPRVGNAELSALTSKLAKLHLERHTRLSARELKELGLTPVPGQLAARFQKLAKSRRASAADYGSTYWWTQPYYGHIWEKVYYTGPIQSIPYYYYYYVYSNYVICNSQATVEDAASPDGKTCIDLNWFTYTENYDIGGNYYLAGPTTNGAATLPFNDGCRFTAGVHTRTTVIIRGRRAPGARLPGGVRADWNRERSGVKPDRSGLTGDVFARLRRVPLETGRPNGTAPVSA
jgi:hypothetical protein